MVYAWHGCEAGVAAQIARRALGISHPLTEGIEYDLQNTRAALRARERQSLGSS